MRDLQALAYHAIDVLGVLRTSRLAKDARVGRLPKGLAWKGGVTHDDHEFIWIHNFWYCRKCLMRVRDPSSVSRSRLKCTGSTPFDSFLGKSYGHKLYSAANSGGGVCIYCDRCFCHASPHPRGLMHPCKGNGGNNPHSRFYLSKGVHPTKRVDVLNPRRVHVSN